MIHGRAGKTACVFNKCADSNTHTCIAVILAEQLDAATVGNEMTANQLFGGGFARTVLTDEAVDRALRNGHIKVIDRIHSAKAL